MVPGAIDAASAELPVWSHCCELDDLLRPYSIEPRTTALLEQGTGWSRQWTATWKAGTADVVCPVREMDGFPLLATRPVRGFSWRPGQRHRPGLKYLVSTGRMHGFESLEERRLLMVLDFVAGGVTEVLAQPFRLDFTWRDGTGRHIPDFLVLAAGSDLLLDVRPAHLIKEDDAVKFAATAQAAAAVGWRYAVVSGWRRQVVTVIDALSARRRPLSDPLGLQTLMSDLVAERPRLLGELVEGTPFPAVARVHLLHLLWHRRLAVDLTQPLGDGSWIYPVGSP